MPNPFARLWRRIRGDRDVARFNLAEYQAMLEANFNSGAGFYLGRPSYDKKLEEIENSFCGYVQHGYKANGIVFSVIQARIALFSEGRFQWQRLNGGRPGDLFGTRELAPLETPWPNGTTGELLARMEQDVSLAGNFYAIREGDRLRRLRPDWVSIVLSAPPDEAVRSDVVGYLFTPGGVGSGVDPEVFLPDEVCHWSPIPDPEAQYRGMSWLTPVLREIQADGLTTQHKMKFFQNGATPQVLVKLPATLNREQALEFVEMTEEATAGVDKAYRSMYIGGGADATVVGTDLRQLDFKTTQGAGETRICAAGRVPPIVVGISEGLEAATYSNYGQARRAFGDGWARPQWRSACAALQVLVQLPAASAAAGGALRLWYDDRDIAFLREDQKDAAEVQQIQAQTIRSLIDAGYKPPSVVAAVASNDWTLLEHTGLFSVQLQPPNTIKSTNGSVPALVGSRGGT